jgi:Undecaprenyl-phosphate glucose phosphotransferase
MDNSIRHIGPSVRSAVFRSASATLAITAVDAGRPQIQPIAVSASAVLLDAVIAALTPSAAAFLTGAFPSSRLLYHVVLMSTLLTVIFTAACDGYRADRLFHKRPQIIAVLRGAVGTIAVLALSLVTLANPAAIPLRWAAAAAALLPGGLIAGRLAIAALVGTHPSRRFAARTVIVGSGLGGDRLARLLRQLDQRALRVVGFVDDVARPTDAGLADMPYLGAVEQMFGMVRRGLVDQVVLAIPWSEEWRILSLIDRLSEYPVHVRLAPDLISYHFPRRVRLDCDGHPILHLMDRPISGWQSVIKRGEDLVVGVLALILCAIPMAAIALLIKLDSPGPVLFRQRRTGFNNREFEMLKFRTMYDHMADHCVQQQATKNDPRVTRIGAILRCTSLDELPQIFNVLRGHMSIVGPRPHAPGTRAGSRPFEEVVDRYAARHRVRPGLTGLAQVRGLRGETSTEDKLIQRVESDLEYIENWSPVLDLLIMLRTAVIVLRMKNAY